MEPTITFPLFGDWFSLDIPRYFTIFGFKIYYYALCIVLGFALAAVYVIRRKKFFGVTTDNVLDVLLIAVPCGLIGARIYYMLFNFNDFFGPGKWGNIWQFREGGLAVYGGIIASAVGLIIYSRVKKISLGKLLDACGFGLFIGQAVGRWGNFINREAYGVETDLPWKMGLTRWGETTYHHPTFLYESLWNALGLLIMHLFSKRFKTKYRGQYFLFYVAWYGIGRFMIEGLRTDSLYIPGTELRVSQWLALASFLVAAGLLVFFNFRKTGPLEVEYAAGIDETGDDDDFDDEYLDDEDPDDTEDVNELARLDGAGTYGIDDEDDDDDDDENTTQEDTEENTEEDIKEETEEDTDEDIEEET